jgi:hypothetical protein
MATIDWQLDFDELVTCNCDFSCPCQFNAPPTHGDCRAAAAYRIRSGHFGDTSLDGVVFAALWAWTGPIHEGRGEGAAHRRRAGQRRAGRRGGIAVQR